MAKTKTKQKEPIKGLHEVGNKLIPSINDGVESERHQKAPWFLLVLLNPYAVLMNVHVIPDLLSTLMIHVWRGRRRRRWLRQRIKTLVAVTQIVIVVARRGRGVILGVGVIRVLRVGKRGGHH